MSNDSTRKTLLVALVLCLVCSLVVSAASVLLKPLQLSNQAFDRKRNILLAAGLSADEDNVEKLYARYIEPRVVELASGAYTDAVDPLAFDARKAARDPALSEAVAAERDIASIKRRPNYVPVYLVRDGAGALAAVVLPVHGYGLWSTMYGFLALSPDTRTVVGLKFYEHAETPGLGGEIDNAGWLAQWPGKIVYDEQWQPAIEIVKGKVDTGKPQAKSQVDGLAGATLTSRGVMYLLQYWLSEQGFGPYLARLRQQQE